MNAIVEMAFKVLLPFSLKGHGRQRPGDVIVTAISYRHKLSDFKKVLCRKFKSVRLFTHRNVALAMALV